jgi:hypothetical protein
MRGIPHDFFGDTSDVDTGPPEGLFFNDPYLGPVGGSAAGGGDSAGTSADDEVVEMGLAIAGSGFEEGSFEAWEAGDVFLCFFWGWCLGG